MFRIILVLVGVVGAFVGMASGQTIVPGGNVSGAWVTTGSPYLVTGDITLPSSATLIIMPGVEVRFQGSFKFTINGLLQTFGTEQDSILFTAEDTSLGWNGLGFFNASPNCRLSYCNIEYGRASGPSMPDIFGGGIYCTNSNPLIEHSTLRYNRAPYLFGGGGGLSCYNFANPTIRYCTFYQNSATDGGAIHATNSHPIIQNCTFTNNQANDEGGAMLFYNCSYLPYVNLDSCSFYENTANFGGAILSWGSGLILTDCNFTRNSTSLTTGAGGGIYSCNWASLTLEDCVVDSNSSYTGGGIFCDASILEITGGLLEQNSAIYNGGGSALQNNSVLAISNAIIMNNSAGRGGAGIYFENALSAIISNCSFESNSSDSLGGGVYSLTSSPEINNCFFSGNFAGELGGAGIYLQGDVNNFTFLMYSCTFSSNTTTSNGAGAYLSEFWGMIRNCDFCRNNSNQSGGGMYIKNAHYMTEIESCQFDSNSAFQGGGLFTEAGEYFSIYDCVFSGNNAQFNGGGLCCANGGFGEVSDCIFNSNWAVNSGGGIFCGTNANPLLSGCEITQNRAAQGGGVSCIYSNSTIDENCYIQGNVAENYGGGIYFEHCSPVIRRSVISNNSAESGGGVYLNFANSPITNCTIYGNSAIENGGGIFMNISNSTISNTIVSQSPSGGGIYFGTLTFPTITYSDFYHPSGVNFINPPAGLGVLNQTNLNGDSCDANFNLLLNPLFYDTSGASAFNLTSTSPCIDAGDPNSPLDPDNTIADIGAFYFDQILVQINVSLTPINPPILIPAAGGSFNYLVTVTNTGTTAQTFEAWIMVRLPSNVWYGPVLGPFNLTLPGGVSLTRNRTQNVPGSAPSGVFIYEARVGDYPGAIWDFANFQFTKLAGTDNPIVSDWCNLGENFNNTYDHQEIEAPSEFKLYPPYPNPFNPTTVISFELRVPSYVKLEVFDVFGRLVSGSGPVGGLGSTTPTMNSIGTHQLTFDGSGLPSGIYLYRLTAEEYQNSGKMVLLK